MIGGAPEPTPDELDEAPDPGLARRRAGARARRGRCAVAGGARRRAVRLLGFSTAAADFLVRHPEECAAFADDAARDSRRTSTPRSPADVERLGAEAGLRRFRRRAMLRVAARDLAGASLDDVVREVSDVADACVGGGRAASPRREHLAVIALGKWGGRELNYASDVDLLFVHARPGGRRRRRPPSASPRA